MRRYVMAALSMSTLVLGSSSTYAAQEPDQVPASRVAAPRNVLLFLVDDATVEDIAYMPQVQSLLVEQGTTFTRHYSPFPLCCPARATILTGMYPHNHRVLGNFDPLGGFEVFDDSETIATWIDDDYATSLVGKYFNDYADTPRGRRYVPPGWDAWRASVEPGTYNYRNQQLNLGGELTRFPGQYSTRLIGEQGRDFLEQQAAGAQPFFLYESFVAPHHGVPRDPDDTFRHSPYVEPRYQDTYDGPEVTNDPSYNEADVSDKRPDVQNHPLLTPRKQAAIIERLAQRREALLSVDDEIAETIEQVTAMGELGSTYFIFASDNGYIQGQHRISRGKSSAYEPVARVPLIIRGPGFPTGIEYDGVTGLQDIAPTILSMTRQWNDQEEPVLDGRSLSRLVKGTETSHRAQLLEIVKTERISEQEVARTDERARLAAVHWSLRGLVTPTGWKYTEYPLADAVEMYDLSTDPFELENLAQDPAYASKRARLGARLDATKFCEGAECH